MKDALGELQSVLILGGTSELAAATLAELPLREGAAVVLAGRSQPALDAQVAALSASAPALAGMRITTVVWDAAGGADAATRVVDEAARVAGRDLDLVLAAAGVLGDQQEAEQSAAAAVQVLTINFVGVAAACLATVQRLREQGHGTLVVFSSVAGLRARRDNFVYGSSKAGLDAFASGLADAVHGTGVSVIVVRPGFVKGRMTEGMTPAPFATTPEAVGKAVAKAVASGTAVVHVPALLGPLFGVLHHAPRPVWRKLGER